VDINTSAIHFDGKPAVLALMRDITERKAMEDELRRQSDLLQAILDNMGDAVVVVDETSRVLACNPSALRMFGLAQVPEYFPPRSDDFQVFLPDRVTPYPHDQRPVTRVIRGEEVDEAEVFIRHAKAPQGRWVSVTARPMADTRCGVRGGILVCRDIT